MDFSCDIIKLHEVSYIINTNKKVSAHAKCSQSYDVACVLVKFRSQRIQFLHQNNSYVRLIKGRMGPIGIKIADYKFDVKSKLTLVPLKSY